MPSDERGCDDRLGNAVTAPALSLRGSHAQRPKFFRGYERNALGHVHEVERPAAAHPPEIGEGEAGQVLSVSLVDKRAEHQAA